jgi:hypothetical protein
VVAIEGEKPKLFMIEPAEPGSCPRLHGSPVWQARVQVHGGSKNGAPAEFYGCREARAFCRSHASPLAELTNARAREAADPTVFL